MSEDHPGFEAAPILGFSEARAEYGHQHISAAMFWWCEVSNDPKIGTETYSRRRLPDSQLSDTSFYEKLDRDFIMDYNNTICEVVKEAITKGEHPASSVNLVVANRCTSSFYMLPKMHKPGNPGRPIVLACNSPTGLIATYLDGITTPLVQSLPSYVKDTKHMLRIADSFRFPGTSNYVFTCGCEIFIHCHPQWRWPLGTDAFSQQ